jgi:acyl dehydratase
MNVHPPEIGTTLPELRLAVTRATAVRYAGAAMDFNPIHYSDRVAAALGLPGVLAHGMWTMGSALRIVTDWVGDPGRIRSYAVRFTKPVVIPDTDEGTEVTVRGTVTSVSAGIVTVTLEATCGAEKVLGNAVVEVVW